MFLEYTQKELEQAEHFETVYTALKRGGVRLLASCRPIRDDKGVAMASRIFLYNGLFFWEHYGSSAHKATRAGLQWILQALFNDCKFFTIIDSEQYNARAGAYYDEQIAKRRAEFLAG